MSIERKADRVLEQAKKMADTVAAWADFSALLFSYPSGLVPQTFPDEMERRAFFDSPQYEQINKLLIDLMKKFGVAAGATPTEKSGKSVKAEVTALVVNGILKLDAPLPFPDQTRVKVTIEPVESEKSALAAWT